MDKDLITWLLDSEPWIEYRTRIDLLGQSRDDSQVKNVYQTILIDPPIRNIIRELSNWPGPILKSHKKAGHFLHKLVFLADIGLKADNPGVNAIVQKITEHISSEGLFQVLVNIHPRFGGSGEDEFAWMLCDVPLVTYAMAKFNQGENQALKEPIEYLINLQRENGWPCAVSPTLGKFRGPGRKSDPCPYANLVMLKLLSQFPERINDPQVYTGIEAILALWEQKKERRPYLFAMGTDFLKLKAPLIWYDLLHVADVLSRFPRSLKDERFHQMLEMVKEKSDQEGKFTAESMWMDWKAWEFGQKKMPSKWVTLIAQRVLSRAEII